MPIEGELVVRYESRAGRVTSAAARCERPRVAHRMLHGRRAREAAPLCASIFSICGRSQAVASQAAVDAALGERACEREQCDADIRAETLHEHAWRIFVDVPKLAGWEPAIEIVGELRRALRDDTPLAWSQSALLGWAPRRFLEIDSLPGFRAWMRSAGTPAASICASQVDDDASLGACDVALLPRGDDGWIASELIPALQSDAAYDERPNLAGAARETGALARMAAHPLMADAMAAWGRGVGARWVARLLDCATLLDSFANPSPPRHGSIATRDGAGIGWVETARGLLVHEVAVDDGCIAAYRIVAPTEWNFHPDGAFTHGARGVRGGARAELDARMARLVASLDPCVGVRYEAFHA